MIAELANYEIIPRIIQIEKKTTITIKPLGKHAAFDLDMEYAMQIMPLEGGKNPLKELDKMKVKPNAQGHIEITYTFETEQEYVIGLYRPYDIKNLDKNNYIQWEAYKNFHVYALQKDLFALKPYRGDFHVHSSCSDGKEEPAVVAANYRKNGFDFFSLTDHGQYKPSLECIQAYENKPVDIKIFRGEEVHAPENPIHIVNFGSDFSVNEYCNENRDAYEEQLQQYAKKYPVDSDVNQMVYASCRFVFDKIREGNGMGIFVHPHWIEDAYHMPEAMIQQFYRDKPFDAIELLGGQDAKENNLQSACYFQYRNGKDLPIVGSSDSHGTEVEQWFKWVSSIVLTEDLSRDSIIKHVMNCQTVVVEKYPSEQKRLYGPFRLVKYVMFLLEYYFPLHDELCFEEGRLMKDLVLGDEKAEKVLALLQGRCAALLNKLWDNTEKDNQLC